MAIEIGAKDWKAHFICDTCHQPIGDGPNEGIVVYKSKEREPAEFLIVHKMGGKNCDPRTKDGQRHEFDCWYDLDEFIEEFKISLKSEKRGTT